MFCVPAMLALFTGRGWRNASVAPLAPADAARLKLLSTLLVASLYLQLILGAAFRHVWTKWGPHAAARMAGSDIIQWFLVPHVVNAVIVTALIVVTTLAVFRRAPQNPQLRRPAI